MLQYTVAIDQEETVIQLVSLVYVSGREKESHTFSSVIETICIGRN